MESVKLYRETEFGLEEVYSLMLSKQQYGEYEAWVMSKRNEAEPTPVAVEKKTRASGKHTSHATPHKGEFQNGRYKVSAERLFQVLDTVERSRTLDSAAKKLGIKTSSVHTYLSIARKNGLMD